ncbi:unnamed protein product [Rhodiola kirilowii]
MSMVVGRPARKEAIRKSLRAGLVFPVGRLGRYLKKGRYSDRVGRTAPVYLASVLEYLAAEVLELAGNAARDNTKKRINPRHIMLSVRYDDDLSKLFKDVTIAHSGVIPNINPVLLRKKKDGPGDGDDGAAPTPRPRKSPPKKAARKTPKKTRAATKSTETTTTATKSSTKTTTATKSRTPKKTKANRAKASNAPDA